MKKILIISALLFAGKGFSQKIQPTYNCKIKEVKKTTMKVTIGYDPQMDKTVKFAFDTYWKHSPIEYVPYKESKYNPQTNFYLGSMRSNTRKSWYFCSISAPYIGYTPNFDYFETGKTTSGIDSTYFMRSIKAIAFIMCFSAEINKIEELGGYMYTKYKGAKEKLSSSNIIIQQEQISSGRLSEMPFKANLKNYTIMDSKTLYDNMINMKVKDNTSLLCLSRDDYNIYLNIIDIKNGELLYYDVMGLSSFSANKVIDDEVVDKLLKNIQTN